MHVYWSSQADADSYILQGHVAGGTVWSDLYSGTALDFNHTGLPASTRWYYRLIAANEFGQSLPSPNVSKQTLA